MTDPITYSEDTLVKSKDLQLGDTIQRIESPFPWGVSIVKQIKENSVLLFRPYGTTAGFSYTGGVICYVGIEEHWIPRDEYEWRLLERRHLK